MKKVAVAQHLELHAQVFLVGRDPLLELALGIHDQVFQQVRVEQVHRYGNAHLPQVGVEVDHEAVGEDHIRLLSQLANIPVLQIEGNQPHLLRLDVWLVGDSQRHLAAPGEGVGNLPIAHPHAAHVGVNVVFCNDQYPGHHLCWSVICVLSRKMPGLGLRVLDDFTQPVDGRFFPPAFQRRDADGVGQVWIVIWVALFDNLVELLGAAADILDGNNLLAGATLPVHQLGEGRIYHAVALPDDLLAVFDIAEDERVIFVKTAGFSKYLAPRGKAGAGHSRGVPVPGRAAKRATAAFSLAGEDVAGVSFHPDHNAGVLEDAVRVEQPGAHHADLGQAEPAGDLSQPIGFDDLDVVIQEQQPIAARLAGAQVVGGGIVERARVCDDAHLRKRLELGVIRQGLRFLAVVLNQDDLEPRVARQAEQRADTALAGPERGRAWE